MSLPSRATIPWLGSKRRDDWIVAGMTLVELLVVIAIIGMLTALLLPASQSARAAARQVRCSNHLRQMGIAGIVHHDAHGVFPASWVAGDPAITWAKSLLPYLEEGHLYDSFDRSISPFQGKNGELAARPVAVFKCPSAPSLAVYEYVYPSFPVRYATIDYKGIQGANGSDPLVAHWGRSGWVPGVVSRKPLPAHKIKDGLSQTIMLVESVGGDVLYGPDHRPLASPSHIWYPTDGAWTGRALSSVSPTGGATRMNTAICTVNCSNMYDFGPYSFHAGGATVVLCDGSVHFLVDEMDAVTLCALYAYDDGDTRHEF